ncbi:hypothetical protein [Nocardiopsis sp. FIRDI 009]|uniref:hypothetical protein n=1 Tax=Nocardiopsis sp. FIRDI 009 TaxID=714197 RepID=UPI000E246612|nr:hypothetical protein [Nocardiopsis sp. FIRDI 009]
MASRRFLTATTAALGLAAPLALAAPAATAESGAARTPVSAPSATGARTESASPRLYYTTWRDASTYWSADTRYATGGWLWPGRHYVFCQAKGQPHTDGQGNDTMWWVLTDDDTGNRDVFVSATAFDAAEPWQPIEGLPRC